MDDFIIPHRLKKSKDFADRLGLARTKESLKRVQAKFSQLKYIYEEREQKQKVTWLSVKVSDAKKVFEKEKEEHRKELDETSLEPLRSRSKATIVDVIRGVLYANGLATIGILLTADLEWATQNGILFSLNALVSMIAAHALRALKTPECTVRQALEYIDKTLVYLDKMIDEYLKKN